VGEYDEDLLKARDDVVAVPGPNGETMYFIVDNMDGADDADLDRLFSQGGGKANKGPKEPDSNADRLEALRQKLSDSLTKTGDAAAQGRKEKSGDEEEDGNGASFQDEDEILVSHDEL